MDMQNVIYAVAVLFIMGIVFAILLGVAAKVFAVEVDERVPLVRECLPGANCGGCGFPGCDGLAAAIVEGRAPVNGCRSAVLLLLRRSQRYSALRLLPATVRLHTFTATVAATQRTRQTTRVCRTATLQCV